MGEGWGRCPFTITTGYPVSCRTSEWEQKAPRRLQRNSLPKVKGKGNPSVRFWSSCERRKLKKLKIRLSAKNTCQREVYSFLLKSDDQVLAVWSLTFAPWPLCVCVFFLYGGAEQSKVRFTPQDFSSGSSKWQRSLRASCEPPSCEHSLLERQRPKV